jgi:hypothetical protein
MALRFRDRFFTPPVARAIVSPLGIVLAGAGTAVGIVVGLPVVAAVGLGAAAWAARVAVAVPRGEKSERIDPFRLSEPWRQYVQGALSAKARFDRAVAGTRHGPLRDRLSQIGERIDTGLRECWRIASRGDDIDGALQTLDTAETRRELAALPASGGANVDRTREALEAQLASADRLARVSADARDRLRLLDARLDELVARAVELSVGPADSDLGGLDAEVEGLVLEMESLRQAIEETNKPGSGGRALPLPGP